MKAKNYSITFKLRFGCFCILVLWTESLVSHEAKYALG